MASVKPADNFDADNDAQAIKAAMKGAGTEEQAIIDILANRSGAQRLEIANAFKAAFGEDLVDKLKSELTGDFEQVMCWSIGSGADTNAMALKKAIKGAGTNENMLINVLCTLSTQELKETKAAYTKLTGNDLEKDICGDTSGDFEKTLVALLQCNRETDCNQAQAKQDVADLLEAGEDRWGTDESCFTRICCTRSWDSLKLTNEYYQKEKEHDLIKGIKKETSSHFEDSLVRIVECAVNRPSCVAQMLYKCMEGAGTDDDGLIQLVLYYSERNIREIEAVFNELYGKTLAEMIEGDTSGDYKRYLLAILA